jgi:hypothetical protein
MTQVLLLPMAWFVALCVALAVAVRRREAASPLPMALALALPVSVLALFFSLALHMHRSLGGWPETIGTNGFPEQLLLHDSVTTQAFTVLLLALLVVPAALLVCSSSPMLRKALSPLAAFAVAGVVAVGLTRLAPEPFLHWWWD